MFPTKEIQFRGVNLETTNVLENRNHWGRDVFSARSDQKGMGYEPASPDVTELDVYHRLATSFAGPRLDRVLVMGMTPGVRHVAHAIADKVICLDKSEAAIDMLAEVLPASKRKHETIIRDDWSNMPNVVEGKVELIMGDGVFANLLNDAGQIEVLTAIYETLTTKGAFVSRCLIAPKEFDLDEALAPNLIRRFRTGEIGEGEFGHGMRVWGCAEDCYDADNFLLDNPKVYERFDAMAATGEITAEERAILQRYFFGGTHFYPTQTYWEGALTQVGFDFKATWLKGKLYNDYLPIYQCSKMNG